MLLGGLLLGCGSERPPPCGANCTGVIDRDAQSAMADRAEVEAPDVSSPMDVPPATDVVAPQDVPIADAGPEVMDAPADVAPEASADVPQDAALDVPQDPPVTQSRSDLGTRGLVASLPCGDVLAQLDVSVTARATPANSFDLRVRNGSSTDTISVWYNATLNTDWNIENLASDLAPGMSVTMTLWRTSGSPAWYVLGIARLQHYYINSDGNFVELPCGRAARDATQRFRRTITP